MWMQFRRRLDRLHPYCRIASHTEGEVRDILLALERIYRPSFPALNLQQWVGEPRVEAHPPTARSPKKRAGHHGSSDETDHHSAGVVLCPRGERCQLQVSGRKLPLNSSRCAVT